jgi:hypothetical protein
MGKWLVALCFLLVISMKLTIGSVKEDGYEYFCGNSIS